MSHTITRLARLALTSTALGAAAHALAGEEVLYEPAPDWVDEAVLPADTAGPPVVLFDDQRRIEEGMLSSYIDRAIRIDNPQMLQGIGTLTASWLPDKGDLTIHAIDILRAGEDIDVLAGGAKFEVLRRETMLEQRMLDGSRTATLSVPGLRVGDILRLRYTITSSDQALDKEVQAVAPLPTKPFEANFGRVMVSWPADSNVEWKALGDYEVPEPVTKGGYSTLVVELPLPESDPVPDDAPVRYRMGPMLQAGTFDGWQEVSSVMAPLYATQRTIAPGSPIAQQLSTIEMAHEGQLERAVAALRVVQDEVAYQLNGMDGGNYIPQSPAQTWEIRYGDCKAKTLLLLAMLREMGIEAEAVTVASLTGDLVPTMLPMPAAFDHVIVRATIEGTDYWLDGTNTGASMAIVGEVPPFHYALPIREQGAELIAMEQRPQTAWDKEAHITFDQRAGLDVPVPWTGEWRLVGPAAGQFRGLIGQANDEQIRDVLHTFAGQEVGNTWVLDTGLEYDEEANAVTVTVAGMIASPWEWERGRGKREFALPSSRFEFRPDRSRRDWKDIPVALAGPYAETTQVTVLLPEEDSAYELDGREAFGETIAGVVMARESKLADNRLEITDSASWPGGELPVARIGEERAKASRFGSTQLLLRAPADAARSFDSASRDERDRFAAIEDAYARLIAEDLDDPDLYRARAWFRNATLNREGALSDLDALVDVEPSAASYMQRAGQLLELGRIEDARSDAQEAWDLNPSLDAAFVLSGIMGEAGEVEEAIALLEDQNADAEQRVNVALAISELEARAGRKEEGLTRLEDLLARRPGDPTLLNSRCWYQATWNYRPEDLEAICTEAVERADWSAPVLDSRAMGYFRLGRFADAKRDLDAALADSPGQTESLYLRGFVRLEMGDSDGRRDIEEALARRPALEREFDRWGIGAR